MSLTAGIDKGADFTGAATNDTFVANTAGGALALTTLDEIDGGDGSDTLSATVSGALNTTTANSVVVKNIESATLTSDNSVTTNTKDWTGLTSLKVVGVGAQTITAAATTDVTLATSAATGATSVNGGNNVTISEVGASGGTVGVGGTTAAAGAVKVTSTIAAANGTTGNAITVTGGTDVTVTQKGSNAVNTTVTDGAVVVNGGVATASVTVVADKAATAGAAAVGHVNGQVDVLDANRASATKAGVITTVSLTNFAAATVNSGALTTLNLSGTGTSVNAGTLGALTTAANSSLAVNLNGLTLTGALTLDTDIKTLNLASATAKSSVATLTDASLATLNVSGDAALTITTLTTPASLKTITVTNTAGLTIATALDNATAFTGGAGADSIGVGATTKALDMGAGEDVVVLSVNTLGAGGSLNGGSGNDTLVANTNGSSFIADPAFTGFETLRVAGGAAQGSHNANGFTALEVGAVNGATTFTNVAAGVGLTVVDTTGAATMNTTVNLGNATGLADTFGLTLKSAGGVAARIVTLAGIETVNITGTDTSAIAAETNTLSLVATSATAINVSGNAGLDLADAGANGSSFAAVKTFDASGVSGAAADAAALGVHFTSQNTTVGENITIKGGSGNDSFTGGSATNDTITGGAGADTLVYTGATDVFSGGTGADTFRLDAKGTSAAYLTISDLASGDKIGIENVTTVTSTQATMGNKVTLGAGATLAQYLDAAAAGDGTVAGTGALATWFQFDGNTYLVIDNAAGGSFVSGTDSLIKINGTVDLKGSAFATEVLTIA